MTMSRRRTLGLLAAASAAPAVMGARAALADDAAAPAAKSSAEFKPGTHAMVPLPFDPKKLKGISEKMIVSHWENNYGGAVKNLNKVEAESDRINKDTPAFVVSGLKERELTFTNSAILHELYFGNLGGDGKPGGVVQAALAEAYGGLARWEEQFRATGGSLGGGSGWAVLDLNLHTGALRTYWSGGHTQSVAFGAPLLVMDMYEHSYQMDFGAAAAKYIDVFFQNVNWDEVNKRFERAKKAATALHG